MARPSSYTPAMADKICAEIACGASVVKACTPANMPTSRTVFRWLTDPANDQFRQQYARAREARADARFESVDAIMQELRTGKIDHNQARVLLDAIKWQTGKEAPKKYGDRQILAGDPDAPLVPHIVVEFIDSPKQP